MTDTPARQPHPQPKEYIITEEELSQLVNEDYANDLDIDSCVRSRLHSSPPAPPAPDVGLIELSAINDRLLKLYPDDFALQLNTQQLQQEQKEHDAQVAKTEREQVLDVFAEVEYLHNVDEITYPDLYNEFIQRYKSLRGAQEEQQAGEHR